MSLGCQVSKPLVVRLHDEYNRAEGNALGEVAKFLVHNARKVRALTNPDEP